MPKPVPQDAPPSPATTTPLGRTASRAPWLPWTGLGTLFFLLGAIWAGAMPLMAGPDEPSHVIWAAAVARGQLSGDLGEGAQDETRPGAGTMVDLPTDYVPIASLANCYAFYPEEPADCQQAVAPPVPGEEARVETFAGQYPPLYYALTGWPSLFLAAEAATYAMRLVTAAVVAVLLAWGVWRLARTFGSGWATWGAVTAVTPMTLFLAGTVNPQALEVAAAFVFWAACLALARGPSPATTGTYVQAAVSGALLVNARSISPVWALAIVVVALVVAPRGRWREVVRGRAARWVGVVAALAAVAAVGWLAGHPVVVEGELLHPDYGNPLRVAVASLSHTFDHLLGMVGHFGWLDTPAPPLTTVAWTVAAGVLVLVALTARAERRLVVGTALLLVAVLGAPAVLQIPTAAQTGLIWQGRYGLPLAIGVPLLAGAVLAGADPTVRDVVRRVGRVVLPLLVAGHVAAFLWAARRFSQGTDEPIAALTPEWSSPLGYLPAVAAYGVLAVAGGWFAWRALRPGPVPCLDPVPAGRVP